MKFKRSRTMFFGVLLSVALLLSWSGTTALAQGPSTYVVQPGDTLWRLAQRFNTTVDELVKLNNIQNPNLIFVGQVLTLPSGQAPTPTPTPTPAPPTGGPLHLSWSLTSWQPADPNYVATLTLQASGGTPPYQYYHDGVVQTSATVEFAWRRCVPKPGSVGVSDASGHNVTLNYWLEAPYCPVGVNILQPEPDQEYTNTPRNFNITWDDTVDPPPSSYGIEIEVWEQGDWQSWQSYTQPHTDRNLFFVPDPFPGDLAGRVRMWGIYDGHDAYGKTPWRYFQFRVTY